MRISDWSSDVCSSDLRTIGAGVAGPCPPSSQPVDKFGSPGIRGGTESAAPGMEFGCRVCPTPYAESYPQGRPASLRLSFSARRRHGAAMRRLHLHLIRSEEHTSELQSLMRISYAVFCLTKKK